MARIQRGYHYVPRFKWKNSRTGYHPGYKRKNRPKGKKRILIKPPNNLRGIKDENGKFMGYTFIK